MIRILSFSYKHMKAVEVKCTTEQYKGDRKGVSADSYLNRFICTQAHLCLCTHIHTQTNIILKCLSFCAIVSPATHLWGSFLFPFLQNQPLLYSAWELTNTADASFCTPKHVVLGDNFPHLTLAPYSPSSGVNQVPRPPETSHHSMLILKWEVYKVAF